VEDENAMNSWITVPYLPAIFDKFKNIARDRGESLLP